MIYNLTRNFQGGMVVMKDNLRGSLNKITAGILAAFCALAIMLAANTAEAGANVDWKYTSITTEPGKCVVKGYFYNNGNAGARVMKMVFTGNVAGRNINCTFQGNNIGVGYVAPGDRRNWVFTISDNYFKSYNNNPKVNLSYNVTFGN